MIDKPQDDKPEPLPGSALGTQDHAGGRRALLRKLGRFSRVTAPAVTLLLAAAAKPDRAQAVT